MIDGLYPVLILSHSLIIIVLACWACASLHVHRLIFAINHPVIDKGTGDWQ